MVKKRVKDNKKIISKNTLVILLIIAIIISITGTFLAVYNSNNAQVLPETLEENTVGSAKIGLVVDRELLNKSEGGG